MAGLAQPSTTRRLFAMHMSNYLQNMAISKALVRDGFEAKDQGIHISFSCCKLLWILRQVNDYLL